MKKSPKTLTTVGILTALCCVPYVLIGRKQPAFIFVLLAIYAFMYLLYVAVGLFAMACNWLLARRASRRGSDA